MPLMNMTLLWYLLVKDILGINICCYIFHLWIKARLKKIICFLSVINLIKFKPICNKILFLYLRKLFYITFIYNLDENTFLRLLNYS